jgi:xanthine dehydrogenase molybdopterin-binding subunit B
MATKKTQATKTSRRTKKPAKTATSTKSKPAASTARAANNGAAKNGTSAGQAATQRRARSMSVVEPKIVVNHDTIAREAYYLWLQRGGDSHSNWLEAEHRLQEAAAKARV